MAFTEFQVPTVMVRLQGASERIDEEVFCLQPDLSTEAIIVIQCMYDTVYGPAKSESPVENGGKFHVYPSIYWLSIIR